MRGEEELQRALLAGIRGWDIEVEDRRNRTRCRAVVLGSVHLLWFCGVDRDDQMWELATSQFSWGSVEG